MVISKYLVFSLFILNVLNFSGQKNDSVWIIGGEVTPEYGIKQWRLDLIFDARRTVVADQPTRIGGVRIGAEHRRVHRFGVGFYGLSNDQVRTDVESLGTGIDTVIFNFGYASLFYERVVFFNPKWEIAATIHLGNGNITASVKPADSDDFVTRDPISVRPLEISASGYFNFTWWLSGGGGMGYRYMRKTPPEVRSAYNGFVYAVKVKIKFGKLVRRIFDSEVSNEY